ncbi:E3 ubiquitin-protein ligase parkin [Pseudolycoriella hygida]|uniref:E3 ubiquitin-protein ligase parkin n=1 Tax=Pseudolycoriella hygida TaxID=35572 RepID=A0A9Q0RV31_9DIPT|nr:E3 ubiquitin-protein ligase parkin [Pseudolycoriella hygida]
MWFLIDFIRNIMNHILQLFRFGRKTITNKLSIYIKTNTGRSLAVDLDPKWNIKVVKELVAPQLDLQPDEVKIIFAGRELDDNIIIEECDLGEKSILHAVKARPRKKNLDKHDLERNVIEEGIEESSSSKPLSQTLVDLQLENEERENISDELKERSKAHFFVHCSQCKELCPGKLRVRCSICKGGAFTVHRDPECWDDVLKAHRIHGCCENHEIPCVTNDQGDLPFAEFYFKCARHSSGGESDFAAPLNLIKINIKNVPCLACTDVVDTVLVFPCASGHVTCLDCFRQYCLSRLMDRQFICHPDIGYTLTCPARCDNSFIEEIHHFKLLPKQHYDRYQHFAAEEYVLQAGGILCPQPGCGMGLIVGEDCLKVVCQGCGFVFCKNCLQGYHLGECLPEAPNSGNAGSCLYEFDPERAAYARWDEASTVTIKVITKPCPQCRTPTERAGGCMHMVCTRSGCGCEWCWVCQTEWTRDCMGAHWFG